MDVVALGGELDDGRRRELAVLARRAEELGAVGEEFGRAALVLDDVRVLVADDAVVGLAARGERERVGRGAVEDEEDLGAVVLEKLANRGRLSLALGSRWGKAKLASVASDAQHWAKMP